MPEDFWKWVERYTRRRARRAATQFDLNAAEIDDLHQELMIDVARRWRWYAAHQGPDKAFVAMTVNHRLADLAKNKIRRVRDVRKERQCESLNEPVRCNEGGASETCERIDLVSEGDHDLRRQLRRRASLEQLALRLDVRHLVNKLPPDLQQVCEYLMQYNIPTTAKRLKIPLSTLRLKIRRLQEHFAELQDYLDQPRSHGS